MKPRLLTVNIGGSAVAGGSCAGSGVSSGAGPRVFSFWREAEGVSGAMVFSVLLSSSNAEEWVVII